MNIKQLHYFHELAKHQHFAKAAKACHITQPTLSASITVLEKNLGTDLVLRTSQFVALTEAGELVRQYAERMLLEQEALKQELALFHGELSGILRIGIVPQSNVDIMPFIARCKQRYPNIVIRLSVLSNEALLSQLALHQCDIGLRFDVPASDPDKRAFHIYPQGQNRMAVLMHRSAATPLPSDIPMTLASLQQQPLVLPSRTMQFRNYLDLAAERAGVSLNVMLETDSLFHLVSAVRHQLGWAIVSAGLASSASQLSDLVCLPLEPLDAGTTVFLTRKQSVTPAMRAFLDLVAEDGPTNQQP
ncbi:LysR family transcriptional regulator [Aeromonas sp. FDAARGOS 1417]|uniref:LysR family transcriptional regulator n=1 Tax=Aeromonas TaxID=642 RepID=UPI001C2420AF|nr:LysR family transcriptional regulator [Aeromonas sp. FDAARGOS 1417]QWZ64361.1 LysR family transcriptional regulator [Aeromonas sp. FDAARGOS 1417]